MEMCLCADRDFRDSTTMYNEIADEYYSQRHITSRNFDQATKYYFRYNPLTLSAITLELGAGRGRSIEYFDCDYKKLILSDISIKMLSLSSHGKFMGRVCCDALNTPFEDESFEYITAFLYDPFNISALYTEIARLLKQNGIFIGTIPHYIWGETLRKALHIPEDVTLFIKDDGSKVIVSSYLMHDDEITYNSHRNSLDILKLESLCLPKKIKKISPHLEIPSKTLGCSVYELPIIQLVMLKKA